MAWQHKNVRSALRHGWFEYKFPRTTKSGAVSDDFCDWFDEVKRFSKQNPDKVIVSLAAKRIALRDESDLTYFLLKWGSN